MARSADATMNRPMSGMVRGLSLKSKARPTNEKAPYGDGALSRGARALLRCRLDAHGVLLGGTVLRVRHAAVDLREQRVVLADADVHAGVELGAALANEDRTRAHLLAAEGLEAQAFRFGIAAVTRRAACFLVCHG